MCTAIPSFKNVIKSSQFLGITIDSNFTFEKHINELCKKGNLKLHALTRCAKFMSTEKRRLIFKAFIISQFNYCPLVWMFHTKQLSNRINSLHKKALRVTYQEKNSSSSELLNLDKSVSIYYGNIKYLLTEIYKVKMRLSPPTMNDIFSLIENSSYNLKCGVIVNGRNIRTSKFGFQTVSTIRTILWNDLSTELKNRESLKIFKQKIKLWSPNNCPCKVCRKFIKDFGYIYQKPKNNKNVLLINFTAFKKKNPAVCLPKVIIYKVV